MRCTAEKSERQSKQGKKSKALLNDNFVYQLLLKSRMARNIHEPGTLAG